jgi:16S rRNA (uracil1498-N3)-methyltransferase
VPDRAERAERPERTIPRFFVDAPLADGMPVALPEEVVRHLQVLRLANGAAVTLFNGQGGEFTATLVELGKRSGVAQLGGLVPREAELPYRVTLAQGIAGGDKMDWLIEKAVELGVTQIVPLLTAKGVVRLTGERALRRQAHWQGLVRAACEQCGRNRLPTVAAPLELARFLAAEAAQATAGGADGTGAPRGANAKPLRLLLSPRANLAFAELPAQAPEQPVTLLIGPEGGLSEAEEGAAREQGFTALALGPRILRTETAGIAVLAALAGRWGGW